MVTRQEIEMAYRLILGREPESEAVIADHMKSAESFEHLRYNFLISDEFRHKLGELVSTHHEPLNWERMNVEVKVSDEKLQRMIARIEREFKYLGNTEPHWSVLTAERYKAERIKENEDEFFQSGRLGVDDLRSTAARCDIDLQSYTTCFELGCGVGRATVWLAEAFPKVVAADISPAHLAIAKEALERYERGNVQLVHLNSVSAIKKIPPFDVFFSIIVLQHNPPPLIAYLLGNILEKLRPGGIAYFQVPTYRREYEFDVEDYLDAEQPLGVPEMHLIPQPFLLDLIERSGCRLLEMREDSASGPPWVSNRLLVQKRAARGEQQKGGSRPQR